VAKVPFRDPFLAKEKISGELKSSIWIISTGISSIFQTQYLPQIFGSDRVPLSGEVSVESDLPNVKPSKDDRQ
jgi:hypothetical protein